jgi:hypothetical protein
MITISFLGLDQFVVGHYSKEHTANLANLYEVSEDDVNFYAPNAMVFHQGVEQTSWHLIVTVKAPLKVKILESKVAEYLLKTLSDFAINVELLFEYYEQDSRYIHFNEAYPRYIKSDNIQADSYNYDGSDYQEGEDPAHDEEEGHHHHHHHDDDEPNPADRADLDPNDPEQIYLGNAFEGFEEKIKQRQEAASKKPDDDKKN